MPARVALSPRGWLARACLVLALALLSGLLGVTYVDRLCDHSGRYLVRVSDALARVPPRPRHTVLLVVDGLTLAHAQRFESVRRLREFGQCRRMTVGPVTLSRPMYAVLSTGLEQDRTGCRHNEAAGPLAAESVWQVARRSGLRVRAQAGVRWWSELFPDGFDDYTLAREAAKDFSQAALADLTLIHPLYVDDAGHMAGAASALYSSATERADRELGRLLERLDFERDALVLTADHGHTAYGGHGGQQAEVAEVLTCFAGRGVVRSNEFGRIAATTLAPTLALLLGVPFPSHMRAGEDNLDALSEVVDPTAFPAAYVAERRAAVARFRAENRAALARWLDQSSAELSSTRGGSASWSALYARERGARRLRLALVLGALAALTTVVLRRRRIGWRRAVGFLLWATPTLAATLAFYVAVSGSLDLTAINGRWRFIGAGTTASLAVGSAAFLLHKLVFAERLRLAEDWFGLVLGVASFTLLEPFVHGWRMGVPVPDPIPLFLPLFAPIFVAVHALVSCVLCLRVWREKSF
jgi:hypothetical protein